MCASLAFAEEVVLVVGVMQFLGKERELEKSFMNEMGLNVYYRIWIRDVFPQRLVLGAFGAWALWCVGPLVLGSFRKHISDISTQDGLAPC